jgi:hypothetical protein
LLEARAYTPVRAHDQWQITHGSRTGDFAMKKHHRWLLATIGIFAAGSASAQTDSTAQQIGKLQDQVEVLQREIQRIKAKVGKAESNAQPAVASTPTNMTMGKVAAVAPIAIATMSPSTSAQ